MIELLILEMILFVIGMYLLKKYDDKAGIKVNKKEYVIVGLIFAATEIVLFSLYGYGRELIYHSLILYYLSVLIFSMFSVMQGTLGWMGWGDVLTYVGMFFYLSTWKYEGVSLEFFAVYMLLANCIFLILNIKNFDWKRIKLKEDVAFLPGMAGALVILELSRLLN